MLSSFYPVVAGRTSDANSRYRSLYQVQTGRIALQELEQQLSTGLRFSLPSQDPSAAIRVIGLQRELEFRDQTLRNLDSSQGYLNATESNLANVQDIVTELRGLGIEAAGNVASKSDRDGWVNQIDASIQRLTSVANTRYLDRYLFTGGSVDTPTVENFRGAVRFTGNELSLETIANIGDYVTHNVTGQKALGLLSGGVSSRFDLNPAALESTRISDINGGQGIAPGAIQISSGTTQVTVDLADAEFVGDVLNKINGNVFLDQREVVVTLNNGALSVNYLDGLPGTLRISEVGSGRTAADLGIETSTPAPSLPIDGDSLDPIIRQTTLLTQLNSGVGFDWDDGLRIQQNGKNYDITFENAVTVEDVLNRIQRSGAPVVADIAPDGRGLRIRSRESGSAFSIGELQGTLAESLGLRTLHGGTSVSELNYGRGLTTTQGADLIIVRNDGTQLSIDLDGVSTVADVLDTINNHSGNQDAATRVTASLASIGNGIQFSSPLYSGPPSPDSGPVKVLSAGGSHVAFELGLVPRGELQSVATIIGSNYTIEGRDPNPQEVKGVFNSLQRLRNAIESQDTNEIARAVDLIDEDLARLSLSRGSLGVEQQRIDSLKIFQEDAKVGLKEDESKNLDADLATVISNLNARQAAYEASLKLLANINQSSLFNYI
jgi:flagellar hook-associated protein 3 FlgL